MHIDWTDLPPQVMAAIEARTGPIREHRAAPAGNHAEIASTIDTTGSQVFVKAARKTGQNADGPEVRSLRWEAAINPYVIEYAPRLLWSLEAGGWLVLGFEHVQARHADYSPGSTDLEVLAKAIDAFQTLRYPPVLANKRVERRWAALADDVSPMAGDALLHADLNPDNLLITTSGRGYVVDWAFACRGAPWVELGLLVPWLLKAGHTPVQAEHWVARFPAWTAAAPPAIDLFCRVFADKWQANTVTNRAAWALEHAAATRRWADHRLR